MTDLENLVKKALKNLQEIFGGRKFITKEETDDLRKKVTRPMRSKKYNTFY